MVEVRGDADGRRQKPYTILNEEKIKQLQNNDISEVCSVLSVSRGLACTLLRLNHWNTNSVFEQWVSNEEKLREAVGLLLPEQESLKPNNRCKICFEKIKGNKQMLSCSCGHPFCTVCWKNYVSVSINEGPGCLSLLCPEPKCKTNVGPEMVDSLSSEEDKEKYYNYLLRSYVEDNRYIKWCPSPGCDRAVQIESRARENYDVTCDCSYRFCWNCAAESHRPVDCKTVGEWIKIVNAEEAYNFVWIMSFTKPCPKCGVNIEKNNGCNHMTCRKPCNFEFCWLCLSPSKYNHICNNDKQENELEKRLKGTKENLSGDEYHYERWLMSNHKSMETALSDLSRAKESINRMLLADMQNDYASEFQFVIEALEQIVECRRVLKWSYVYGYYLSLTEKETKIAFFEFVQGDAESVLERLHHCCARKEMEKYLNADCRWKDFMDFRAKVVILTNITRDYFEKFVRALENDLPEVAETSVSQIAKN